MLGCPLAENCSPPIVHESIVSWPTWEIPLRTIAKKHLKYMHKDELDANWKLHEFFPTIAVINLAHATQRLAAITKELHDIGTTEFLIFEALDGTKDVDRSIWSKLHKNLHNIQDKNHLEILHQKQAGCYLSHFRLIQMIKNNFDNAIENLSLAQLGKNAKDIEQAKREVFRYSRILILEDDSGFGIIENGKVCKQNAGYQLRTAFMQLPDTWDILYFVIHASEPTDKVSSNLYKIKKSWSCSGYAVNYKMYEPLIEHLKKIENPDINEIMPVDNEISSIHHKYNVYALYPALIFSQPGQSCITGKKWGLWQEQPIFLSKKSNKKK